MSEQVFEVPLRALDGCFEGGVPATLCTCARDGTPNTNFLSVVHRVDDEHVALSFQYFRKTKQNLAENPKARLLVVEPNTAVEFRLSLEFIRSESQGPTFERLATSVTAIASQTGMEKTFKLQGADIYRVTACERFSNSVETRLPTPSLDCLAGLSRCTARLASCTDLDSLLQCALEELASSLGHEHAFVLAVDESERTLFSVASRGYSPSGVGAELCFGEGLIGMAAERRIAVRVANMSREHTFADAVHTQADEPAARRAIPMPGLRRTESQLALPLLAQGHLLGVLCLQSDRPAAFGRIDEEILGVVAAQLASGMLRFGGAAAADGGSPKAAPATASDESVAVIRYYAEDDSVFVDNDYLIKGVAGRILWALLRLHQEGGRREFSNRELRLDGSLGLPPVKDNLETRLIMLRKRLEEKAPFLGMRSVGRGRFALDVQRPLRLEET